MSGRYCVDANVFIDAWHQTYPRRIFGSLWDQLASHRDAITLIEPIYAEIEPILPQDRRLDSVQKRDKYPLRMWLTDERFEETAIDDSVETRSLALEREYEISDRSRGANKNDMKLIAYTEITRGTVVTLERGQLQSPLKRSNYKIPLICREKSVPCINFVDMLGALGIRV